MAAMDAILEAREQRWRERLGLVARFQAPLVTISLNIPGPDKNLPGVEPALNALQRSLAARYRRAFVLYLQALALQRQAHPVPGLTPYLAPYLYQQRGTGADGPFWHMVSPLPALTLKQLAVQIEGTHSLGRLADVDVMDADGTPVSRQALNLLPRACFLCGEQAAVCRRLGRHAPDEVLAFARALLESHCG